VAQNRIDPRAVILGDVRLGSGNVVEAGAVLVGPIVIGDNNYFGPNCVVGAPPQDDAVGHDLRRNGITAGSEGQLSIGSENVFREFVTVHRGLTGETTIGHSCYLMAYVHVAHDCTIRDYAKLANNVQMGGYTWLGRETYVGLSAVLHQFTVVGAFSMVGMGSVVTLGTVPPASLLYGNPASLIRANSVALNRIGVQDTAWWTELTGDISGVQGPVQLKTDIAEFRSQVAASATQRAEVTAWRSLRGAEHDRRL
jgi:UDP-N-acetylglucosamine acyltransferase